MTKLDFKTEYQKQVANDIPDLWSRIEAGIDAIPVSNSDNNVINTVDFKRAKKDHNNIRFNKIVKYSSVLVAAACAVIVVVAVINNTSKMDKTALPKSARLMRAADEANGAEANYFEAADEDAACEEAFENPAKTNDATTKSEIAEPEMTNEAVADEAMEEEAENVKEKGASVSAVEKEVLLEEIIEDSNNTFIKIKDDAGENITALVQDEVKDSILIFDVGSTINIVLEKLEEPLDFNGEIIYDTVTKIITQN